ncbi:MAG: MBOAT family protein [Firmicutes bacterium]|nr:MBOAT family protein [Bacillota bacterium]
MVFSSLLFLFYFLPAALFLYYLAPRPWRNLILFVLSLFFYAWGEPVYIVLMIFSAIVDYSHGLLIDRFRHRAKYVVASSVLVNLGLLGFFKYADFLVANLNLLVGIELASLDLPLPIGISFYTFQTMSYTIDVYRKQAPVQRSFIAFAAYISMFPQLIAGPIVRYRDIAAQLTGRRESIDRFAQGVKRFVVGLGKKVLLANNIGLLWSEIQQIAPGELPVLTAWLGIVAFGFQIYFDFSGYSDMAIGLGNMFGFKFLENFNYPYISRSVTEFWRRWHISLGAWFRDYLYIPLGGNRSSRLGLFRNLFVVWLLTGLWHGASWNFMFWGLYFGALISIEKLFFARLLARLPRGFQHGYLLLAVFLGWVLFVFEDFAGGLEYLQVMFGLSGNALWDTRFLYYALSNGLLLTALVLGSTPLPNKLWERLESWLARKELGQAVVVAAIYFLILIASTAYLVDATYNPFLYFRF